MDSDIQSYRSFHRNDQGYGGRMEIMTGPTGRRRWPDHVKAAMVLESFREGVSVADMARRHGVAPPQLHAWRRAARAGLLALPEDEAMGLMPIEMSEVSRSGSGERTAADLQLEIGGVRINVPVGFDAVHLVRVVAVQREQSL